VKGKNGVTYKSAVEYNDYIVNRQTSLIRNILDFSRTADVNLDSAEVKLRSFIKTADEIIKEVSGMPAYKGDTSLRDAAIRSFSFYKKVFEEDYAEYLRLRKKGEQLPLSETDAINETSAEINRIIQKVTREEENYDKAFHNAQQHYAEKNNMKLTENRIQKEIEKAGGN
jgi:hypothetical protein